MASPCPVRNSFLNGFNCKQLSAPRFRLTVSADAETRRRDGRARELERMEREHRVEQDLLAKDIYQVRLGLARCIYIYIYIYVIYILLYIYIYIYPIYIQTADEKSWSGWSGSTASSRTSSPGTSTRCDLRAVETVESH